MVADRAVPSGRGSVEVRLLRSQAVSRWLAVVASAAVALSGCGGGAKRAGGPLSGPLTSRAGGAATPTVSVPADLGTPNTSVAPTAEPPPATVRADDLAATTAIPPPDGFTELPAGSRLGPLDLAAASLGDGREREALTRFRFRDGHARGFVSGGEEVVVTVLRFSSPADAEAYLQDTIDSSLVSNGSFLFTVPVPGATGYREQGAGQDGEPYVTYGALFTRGDRCFEQLVRSPATGPERTEADVQTLARRQADRVGG